MVAQTPPSFAQKIYAQNLEVDAPPSTIDENVTPMNEPTTSSPPAQTLPQSNSPIVEPTPTVDVPAATPPSAPLEDSITDVPVAEEELESPTEPSTPQPTEVSQPAQITPSKDKTYIDHPWSEKGLIKIEKSGAYLYKTSSSPIDAAFSLRAGTFDPVNLENPDADVTFGEIYSPTSGPMLLLDYELRFLRSFGKMGLKLGGGLFLTSGRGVFEEDPTIQAIERYTFVTVPLTAGLIYRAQYFDKQPLVLYAEGGVLAVPLIELRDDGADPKFGGTYGLYFAGGVQFDMALLGSEDIMNLDREYGINKMWLQVEFRSQINLGAYDFSGNLINAGFLFEY